MQLPTARTPHRLALTALPLAVAALLGACSSLPRPADGALRKDQVVAVTASNQLIRFNAGQPGRVLSSVALTGLQAGETVLGIDYRIAKGQLYALGSTGRLYRIDVASGTVEGIGAPLPIVLSGDENGFDVNPTVDRIRVVGTSGQNLRLHPDTGAVVDGNPALEGLQTDAPLRYADGDMNAGRVPAIVAAGYTYNKDDEKITTNYAIDANFGTLVMQGSREGVKPVVSPNTGLLRTVGPLDTASFKRAAFDIAD
ncbi:MAG: DUF4394 domain-containing protein, partial [Ideonella sp.]|nr:DUF4394 domain-containing protein [Ideonella sp.]